MKFSKLSLILFLFTFAFLTSCNDDDDIGGGGGEEELITTLNFTLTSTSGDVVTLSFQDLDGDGGDDPIISGGTLAANTTYTGITTFLNESETPAEDVTIEVREEDDEHQVFFIPSSSLNATVSYSDEDDAGNPVGLTSSLTTGDASSGTLQIILRHEPDKSASGVAGGDITNAGGETDIEVSFDVTIQ